MKTCTEGIHRIHCKMLQRQSTNFLLICILQVHIFNHTQERNMLISAATNAAIHLT